MHFFLNFPHKSFGGSRKSATFALALKNQAKHQQKMMRQ